MNAPLVSQGDGPRVTMSGMGFNGKKAAPFVKGGGRRKAVVAKAIAAKRNPRSKETSHANVSLVSDIELGDHWAKFDAARGSGRIGKVHATRLGSGRMQLHDPASGEKMNVNESRFASALNQGHTPIGIHAGRLHTRRSDGSQSTFGSGFDDGRYHPSDRVVTNNTMGATADGLARMGLGKSPEAVRV